LDRGTPAHSLRILLAEDNPVNQLFAVRLLEKQGHSVFVAGNGREVLELLNREDVDLVLMDVQMPELEGRRRPLPARRYGRLHCQADSCTPIGEQDRPTDIL
jgi:AmiR/NasT family two-component response regulator